MQSTKNPPYLATEPSLQIKVYITETECVCVCVYWTREGKGTK